MKTHVFFLAGVKQHLPGIFSAGPHFSIGIGWCYGRRGTLNYHHGANATRTRGSVSHSILDAHNFVGTEQQKEPHGGAYCENNNPIKTREKVAKKERRWSTPPSDSRRLENWDMNATSLPGHESVGATAVTSLSAVL